MITWDISKNSSKVFFINRGNTTILPPFNVLKTMLLIVAPSLNAVWVHLCVVEEEEGPVHKPRVQLQSVSRFQQRGFANSFIAKFRQHFFSCSPKKRGTKFDETIFTKNCKVPEVVLRIYLTLKIYEIHRI